MKRLAIALAVLATPAAAQTQRCGWELGQWVCRQDPPPPNPSGAFQRGFEAARRNAEAAQDAQRNDAPPLPVTSGQEGRPQNAQPNQLPLQVGALLDAGKCDEGIALALRSGDIPLATAAKEFCSR